MFIADNKCMQIVVGIDNGKCPCTHCYTPISLFKDYYASVVAYRRSMDTILQRTITASKTTVNFGDNNIPMFYDAIEEYDDAGDKFTKYVCAEKKMINGVDVLHDIQNTGNDLVDFSFHEFATVYGTDLVKEQFRSYSKITVVDNNGKISFADTTCSNIRFHFFVIEHIFLNMCVNDSLKDVMDVLRAFKNLIIIMYSSIYVRTNLTVLLFYVNAFIFTISAIEFFVDRNITHFILFHFIKCSYIYQL